MREQTETEGERMRQQTEANEKRKQQTTNKQKMRQTPNLSFAIVVERAMRSQVQDTQGERERDGEAEADVQSGEVYEGRNGDGLPEKVEVIAWVNDS